MQSLRKVGAGYKRSKNKKQNNNKKRGKKTAQAQSEIAEAHLEVLVCNMCPLSMCACFQELRDGWHRSIRFIQLKDKLFTLNL